MSYASEPVTSRAAGRASAPSPGQADAAAIVERIHQTAPARGSVRLVCIDGPAGSGKTTLAARLADELAPGADEPVPVVHMDDLYSGWDQELGPPLAADVTRWLLSPWERGDDGLHPVRDWIAGRIDHWHSVPAAPVVILEGCGSASTGIRDRAGVVIWVEADPDERLARGIARDGEELSEQWREWQRRESAHFAADGTREAADVIVVT